MVGAVQEVKCESESWGVKSGTWIYIRFTPKEEMRDKMKD